MTNAHSLGMHAEKNMLHMCTPILYSTGVTPNSRLFDLRSLQLPISGRQNNTVCGCETMDRSVQAIWGR